MRKPDADQAFDTVAAFCAAQPVLPAGPVAVVLCESCQHAGATVRRLADLGAAAVVVLGDPGPLATAPCPVVRIAEEPSAPGAHTQLNQLIDALSGRWLSWHWNAEFLFFPYCETRHLADLTGFLADERRVSLYCYALDLYADTLPDDGQDPAGQALWFDTSGYHAFPQANQQLTVFGGLGWRFQEFTPPDMSQIGRIALFRAEKGVHLGPNLMFEDESYASVSCPWHNNPTGAVMSLRRASRVMAHPNFGGVRDRLFWSGSTQFDWRSSQLLDLGMIEPGQWF